VHFNKLEYISMNVLLTGANGFLGKAIFEILIIDNHIVLSLSKTSGDYKIALEKEIPTFDLNFDLVIHAAGKAHSIPKTEYEKQQFYNVNVVGTNNLLEGLTKSGIPKHFVFISSVSVYGKDFGSGIDENSPLLAKDPYGLSKVHAEQLVSEWCNKNNVIITILRLPLLAGQNPPGNLRAMIKGIQSGFYFNIDGGKAKKSMVLAEDVAKCVLKAADVGGIFNLTDGYHPSFAELSNHISIQLGKGKSMNMPIWLAKIIAKFGDLLGSKAPLNNKKLKKITSDLIFDDSKARKAFGWNPTPVLKGFKLNTNAQ
jgi:nucleoside-diphosphate-sugar epimerase